MSAISAPGAAGAPKHPVGHLGAGGPALATGGLARPKARLRPGGPPQFAGDRHSGPAHATLRPRAPHMRDGAGPWEELRAG